MSITVASPRIVAGSGPAAVGRLELEEQALMAHDQHRHDHDRGLMTKLHWLLRIRHFWMSDVNRAVVDLADPKPGERGLDVGAGMGPATVLAAKRGAHVVAVDPSGFMRAFCGFRRLGQRARRRVTVESGVAEDLPVAGGSTEVLWATNAVHHWVDHAAVWREFARVLAPGGRLVLVDEDFDDPTHPDHEKHAGHEAEMTPVDVAVIVAAMAEVGLRATGEHTTVAGVPAKVIRAVRTD
jgi:SAM-dependent methyltransferase